MADDSETRIDTADVLAVDEAVSRATGAAEFGVTKDGFVPKPFAWLLAEKLSLARALFGDDLDLSSGSAIRKILEITALEDARTWAALAAGYDNAFVTTATATALTSLGQELGIDRPFDQAKGSILITLVGALPENFPELPIPRGARLLTLGGHHVATDEGFTLSLANPERDVSVLAFHPGPSHNLDPGAAAPDGTFPQKIERWNPDDPALSNFFEVERLAAETLTQIEHTAPLTGGEQQWPDERYRALLLQAPRSLWTVDAIRVAVSLVPGVRQVQVRDGLGGLDINQSIFGNFNFLERVFGSERNIGAPYYFTILVAPTPGAIWDGPGGLWTAVQSAVEDLRPVGIFPNVEQAEEVNVGIHANLVVEGLPLPTGSRDTVNQSQPARELKKRLRAKITRHFDQLDFGQAVRAAGMTWVLMNDPNVADVKELKLMRYPPEMDTVDFAVRPTPTPPQPYDCGANVSLKVNQIAVYVDREVDLVIV